MNEENTRETDNALKPADAAAILGVTPQVLSSWRKENRGPRYQRMSRKTIRYREKDVRDWLAGTFKETIQD